MKRNLLWRGLLILAVAVACFALAYPPKDKINLGLDLQGGMHLVLQVHTEDAVRAETDTDMARLVDLAKDKEIARPPGPPHRRLGLRDHRPRRRARDAVSRPARSTCRAGRASRQGDDLVFTMNDKAVNEVQQRRGQPGHADDQQPRRPVRRHRAGDPGQATGHRIVVQLPGVDDCRARAPADQEHRLPRVPHRPRPQGGRRPADPRGVLKPLGGQLPPTVEIMDGDQRDRETQAVTGKTYYAVEKRRTVTGRDLSNARPSHGQFGQPIVEFTLKPAGAEAFARAHRQERRLAASPSCSTAASSRRR